MCVRACVRACVHVAHVCRIAKPEQEFQIHTNRWKPWRYIDSVHTARDSDFEGVVWVLVHCSSIGSRLH